MAVPFLFGSDFGQSVRKSVGANRFDSSQTGVDQRRHNTIYGMLEVIMITNPDPVSIAEDTISPIPS